MRKKRIFYSCFLTVVIANIFSSNIDESISKKLIKNPPKKKHVRNCNLQLQKKYFPLDGHAIKGETFLGVCYTGKYVFLAPQDANVIIRINPKMGTIASVDVSQYKRVSDSLSTRDKFNGCASSFPRGVIASSVFTQEGWFFSTCRKNHNYYYLAK